MAKQRTDKTPKTSTVLAKGAVIEVLNPIEEQELSAQLTLGASVVGWLAEMSKFFREAIALERLATKALDEAKALKPPKTVADDQALQLRIKAASAGKKNHLAKWAITSALSQLHKRAVAVRKRGEDAWDETIEITNNMHQRFAADAKREADRLQEIERQATALRAKKEREDELEQLENEALEAEEKAADLSAREVCYVDAILMGMTPAKAAKTAGYKNPEQVATRLETSTKILAAISGKREAAAIRQQAAAVQAAPITMGRVEQVKPALKYVAGAGDRTYRSAKLIDGAALIKAVIEGKLGIPLEVLQVNEVELNVQARKLGDVINRWPGVEFVEDKRLQ